MSNGNSSDIDYVLERMERKNLCLRSFHGLCGVFLDQIAKDKIDALEDFQRKRQSIIKVMELLESEIVAKIGQKPYESILANGGPSVREKIAALLAEKDSLIKAILDLDAAIVENINRLKGDTLQKLQSVQIGKKTISAYKSPLDRVEATEKHNKILDKKA